MYEVHGALKMCDSRLEYPLSSMFPAARVRLEIRGKEYLLTVGVSNHLPVDVLVGQEVPDFGRMMMVEETTESNTQRVNLQSRIYCRMR